MNNTLKRTITGAGIVGAIMASLIVSEYVFVGPKDESCGPSLFYIVVIYI